MDVFFMRGQEKGKGRSVGMQTPSNQLAYGLG